MTILTITDTFSKASIFIPCNESINAENTAKLYATYVLPHYGLPTRIISDRDPRFTATFSRELCRTLGITQNISTAYHPQTDGQSEHTNQRLEQYLRIFIDYHQQNWASLLPLAQYTLNAWPNSTTKKAPFELIMGHIPRVHQSAQPFKSPTVEVRMQQIKQARQDAKEALKKAADLEIPTRFEPYQLGDKVWLEGRNLTTTHPTAKLAPRRYGPFPITCVVSHTSYQLKLPPQWKIHNVFHATLLTPYKETALNGSQNQEPAPELIDGQPEWEVEQILHVRRYRRQVQYLIRWKGFSEAHDSWEPATNVHADELIQEFYKRHPKAIHNLTTQAPITICTITMSATPLSERIENAPSSLSLADRLSSPTPSAPLSLAEHLADSPSYIPSSPITTEEALVPIDTDSHNHYVYTTRDDLRRVKYGWVLEAVPFTGCTSPGIDETNLQVLLGSEDQRLGANIALNTIDDKGVTADTDCLRELAREDVDLTRREHELADERTRWRVRNAETRSRLIHARVHSRIHPYLNHTALIPDHYRPETMCTGGVTLATAVTDTRERNIRWNTMPQYHDDDAQASRSTKPTPFPHRCRLCKQLQPRHMVWDCPARKDCHYCRGCNHFSEDCNNPHALCFTKSECVVPFTHRHTLSRTARRCPVAHLHSRYYTDDWVYDGEDTTYDDYDWEA